MKRWIAYIALILMVAGIPAHRLMAYPVEGGGGGGGTPDDDSVTSAKIVDGTIVVGDIADNTITSAKLLDNTVATGKIADGTIVNADVNAAANIDMTKIGTGAVTNTELNYISGATGTTGTTSTLLVFSTSPVLTTPTLGVASATTLNMGQGANVLWPMDQAVRAADNVTFASVTAGNFISNAADNTRGITVPNTADPTGANLAPGKGWWNNTSNMLKWSGSDNAVREVFTSGAAHTLNLATTGTITGGIMILDNVVSPTAAQCYGSWNTITTAGTVTLPAAAPGMSTCIATEGALEITLELDGSDTFVLNGVVMDAGEAIINTTAEAAGDYICVIATSAVKWRVAGKQGTWTQATP